MSRLLSHFDRLCYNSISYLHNKAAKPNMKGEKIKCVAGRLAGLGEGGGGVSHCQSVRPPGLMDPSLQTLINSGSVLDLWR